MRLIRPSNVRRGDEEHGDAAVSRRLYKLVNRPVLQHETYDEHENAEGPEDGDGRDLAGLAVTDP